LFQNGQDDLKCLCVVRIGKIVGCGLEDIRYQFLKNLPESSLQAVLDLMNGIWEAGDMPSIWKLANVIPMPKPGKDHSEPSHYRPIALTNADSGRCLRNW
jgi:hypothetical protein